MFRYGIPPFPLPSNDVGLHLLDALIFLVLLEYSFVSYFFTRRTFDCSHRAVNSECSRRLQTKQGHGTTAEEANRAAGNELKERGGRRQTKPAEMVRLGLLKVNSSAMILPFLSKSRKAGGGFVFGNLILFTKQQQHPCRRPAALPTHRNGSVEKCRFSDRKRRRFCRMNNIREEQQMMGRNHSEEGILMGLGMMEEERGEGVPMPPRENGLWDWDEEDGRGAAGSGGRSWRSTGIGTHCQQCQWEDEMRGRSIDRYSRALFPTIFFSFCLAYWLYYWVLMNHE
uniref:Uncharacterized protein n=1 Tax=Globodera rostochiensis TaxID=31243 RepID=A0A914I0W7_GLORO